MKAKQFVWRRSANILKVIYIRQSSNGLGHGLVLLDVGSNPAWRAEPGLSRALRQNNILKTDEREFFGLLSPKPILYGEAAKSESRGGLVLTGGFM